jgi:3-phytase/alkaline phosphatase D
MADNQSKQNIRFASFNVSLYRDSAGELITDLSTPDNEQAQAVAEIIQRKNPDVLLLNEFDYDENGNALSEALPKVIANFQNNYLEVSQNGIDPVDYPYVYLAPSNTGIPSGFDFDNNGSVGGGNDAFGFGFFPGQYGMVLLSKYPIVEDQVRTFQNFLWKDMPGALLPDDVNTAEPNDWYSAEELEVFRLSSKSHWDIPVNVNGEIIHVLASHPTPPVFDGEEDRNGKRNHDEIRFWADYVTPGEGSYIYDDNGGTGGLNSGEKFVIMGDQNADPNDGDSTNNAILQLLDNPLINTVVTPSSEGGIDAANRQGEANENHTGNPAFDTADFADAFTGNLRADYVLPSNNLDIASAGVFWPESDDPQFGLVGDFPFPSSDHRLVYADVQHINVDRKTVSGVNFLGEVTFPTGLQVDGTEVGGISGLAYDASKGIYYGLSDDRSQINPARFYDISIDLSDGSLDDGDITFDSVTTLLDRDGNAFPESSLDPEGIALTKNNTIFISSEGDANQLINPFVNEFSINGQEIAQLPVPEKFLPIADQSSGIRNNLAFESLTITPNQRYLYTATENALFQDGAAANVGQESLSRILKYDLQTRQPVGEFVYEVGEVPQAPDSDADFRTNGLVELLATDNNGTLLALERSFSAGKGNTVRLYEVQTQGALDVSNQNDLFREDALEDDGEILPPGAFEIDPAVSKRLLIDFEADLGITPDNLEALAFGPTLADGSQSLIVASDNNFSDTQTTQFLALGLDFDTTPAALPTVETPYTIDEQSPEAFLAGDSDDPAIWVNPEDSGESIVIGTLKDGGLATFNLQGEIQQRISPEEFGEERFNNVDIIYNFPIASMLIGAESKVDLAVVSDRENDTLAIFSISENGELSKFRTPQLDDAEFSIFGVDDGEATAYGLATYTSPVSGKSYVFVTQASGNKVAQLELTSKLGPADEQLIEAEVVRTLELPIPTGDAEDSQSEGIVIDQELGFLYVALENEVGILKFSAEPTGGSDFTVVQPVDADYLVPDIEGLSIYYGDNGTGYLIANSQGDSSYAVFSREGTNEYLGSFVVGENNGIDQVNESDGLDVINLGLGSEFPNGLLVLQDGANDPQNAVEDDEELENNSTNFKFVPWDGVANSFDNPLQIDTTSYNPRNPQSQSLVNGIASGDTTQNSTVLWARSTFTGEVTFEYSTDASFNSVIGTVTANVDNINVPVKVEIEDLTPATEYYYRVTDAAGDTAIGEFETSAEVGNYQGLRFGVSGDWRGELAPYPVISNAPQRDLAFFVEHGDTIYADDGSPAVLNEDGTFKEQAETIEEYRAKHNEVYSSRFGKNTWADLRSSTSILATIDDHEVTNDFAGGADASTDDRFVETSGLINDTQLYETGLQAFQEYNPLRDDFYGDVGDELFNGERKLYRYNTYGSDAATITVDTRSFRDRELVASDFTDPADVARVLNESLTLDRTLLGEVQLEELKQDLLTAQADGITWKFINIPEPIQNIFPGVNVDAYEGYGKERTELLKFIESNNIDNVVFVAADVHTTFVNNLTYQEEPFGEQIATSVFEITTGAVAYERPTGEFLADLFIAQNPDLKLFYDSLPVAPDTDNNLNDKDDFVKKAIDDTLLTPLGFDPLGLDNNLPQAEGLIDATLLEGDYFVGHSYAWTEFDIDKQTQALTVTTYGIDSYTEAELLANPQEIANLTPQVVSKFVVNPQDLKPTLVSGSNGEDLFIAGDNFNGFNNILFAGGGSDEIDLAFGGSNNRVNAGSGDDLIYVGNQNRVFGSTGNDEFDATDSMGKNRISGGEGNDIFFLGKQDRALGGDGDDQFYIQSGGDNIISGGAGTDQFWIVDTEIPESANTIVDFEIDTDVIGILGSASLGIDAFTLQLTEVDGNTEIAFGGNALAILNGVTGLDLNTSVKFN